MNREILKHQPIKRKLRRRTFIKTTVKTASLVCLAVLGVYLAHSVTGNSTDKKSSSSCIITQASERASDQATVESLPKFKSTMAESFNEASSEIIKETKLNKEREAYKNKYKAGDRLYTTSAVKLRKFDSTEADVVEVIEAFSKVKVLKEDMLGWIQVEHNKNTGYIKVDYLSEEMPLKKVSSTAYYDQYHRNSCSGRTLVEGLSVAAMRSQLGKRLKVYKCNEDGTVGEYIGTYRVDDIGYGQETGHGQSKVLRGRTIGTIENGTCIDFFMNTYEKCIQWGRRNVFIQFID